MLTADLIAVVLALCSAVCIALGAVLRQRSSFADAPSGVGSVLRQPLWWLGLVTGLAGFGFQASALGFGPILLVQPVLVTSLLFVLPLGMAINGTRPSGAQWVWALSLTCAIGLIVAVADPKPGHNHFAAKHWVITAALTLCLVAAAWWALLRSRGRIRAIALGAVSGGLFGIVAILTKMVTTHLDHVGPGTLLTTAEPAALVVVAGLAFLTQYWSYQAGELRASFPAALLAEQIVAATLGIVALGESLDAGPAELTLLAVVVAFAGLATIRLAASDSQPGVSA